MQTKLKANDVDASNVTVLSAVAADLLSTSACNNGAINGICIGACLSSSLLFLLLASLVFALRCAYHLLLNVILLCLLCCLNPPLFLDYLCCACVCFLLVIFAFYCLSPQC